MKKTIKTALLLISLISVSMLSGCTTPGKNMLPHGDMTMAQIYRIQMGLAGSAKLQTSGKALATDYTAAAGNRSELVSAIPVNAQYTEVAQNQLNSEFKILPNPNIAAYVFPHMSHYGSTNVPVPGYTTTFFLYEKNHYAMPGEEY